MLPFADQRIFEIPLLNQIDTLFPKTRLYVCQYELIYHVPFHLSELVGGRNVKRRFVTVITRTLPPCVFRVRFRFILEIPPEVEWRDVFVVIPFPSSVSVIVLCILFPHEYFIKISL